MNLRKKIADLEKRLKVHERRGVVAISAYTELEFEEKVAAYLKSNLAPEFFMHLREFTLQDCRRTNDE